jgi:hypothetical protein
VGVLSSERVREILVCAREGRREDFFSLCVAREEEKQKKEMGRVVAWGRKKK